MTSAVYQKPLFYYGLLALLLLVHVASNALWLGQNASLRGFDEPPHMTSAVHAIDLVRAKGAPGVLLVLRGRRAHQWPSAGYLPWVGPSLVFGQSDNSLRMQNMLYFALLLWSLFALGRRLLSPGAGCFAAALVTLFPAIFGASRQFNQDLPYIAMVSANLALLMASERFSRPLWSLLFGLALGTGCLIRPHSLIFIFPPLVGWALFSLVRPVGSRLRTALGLLLGAIAALAVSALWWFDRLPTLGAILKEHWTGRVNLPWMNQPSLLFYLGHLHRATSGLLLVPCLMGIIALVVLRRLLPQRPGLRAEVLLVAAWLVLGLLGLSLFEVHLNRYQYPLLPALGLLGACGLWLLPWPRLRHGLAFGTLLVGTAMFFLCSFSQARPLPAPLMDCDPCGSRELFEPWESAGPPHRDPVYAAAQELAQAIETREGSGDGVVIQMHPHLRLALMVKPVLMTRLPLVQFTQRDYRDFGENQAGEECESQHQTLGGFAMHLHHSPFKSCYTLQLDYTHRKDPPPLLSPVEGASQVWQRTVEWDNGTVRFRLWHHARCPERVPAIANPDFEWLVEIPCP